MAPARLPPGLIKPVCLMGADYRSVRERIFQRYPYFRTSLFERRMLFERRQPLSLAPEARSPIEGLKISSQSWRRGGLGSKALVTFTLRNANDYPVRDVEIACAFARRDGSHLTDRRRLLPDTLNMRSRKTYSGMLVGFVNVNANKAKCSAVAASRA